MAIDYSIDGHETLVLKVEKSGFNKVLSFSVYDRAFLILAKQWLQQPVSPELSIALSDDTSIVVSNRDLEDIGELVCKHIEGETLSCLVSLLAWDHIVLKVGAGPYNRHSSGEVVLGGIYAGGVNLLKDYVDFKYFPPGTVLANIKKYRNTISLQCQEIIAVDNRYRLVFTPIHDLLDVVDWAKVIQLLRTRVRRKELLAFY